MLNFILLSGGGGPDGIAVDSEGGLAVSRIYVTEAESGTIQVADVPIHGSVMFSHMAEA